MAPTLAAGRLDSLAPVEIPDRALQSALEFAVGVAAAGAKLRPPLEYPSGLKPFLRFHTLPAKALAPVRAAVEGDAQFLGRLGKVATRELLDDVGMWWLTRPEGWEAQIAEALAGGEAGAEADDPSAVRKEQRRREAAEAAAARARLELVAAQEALAQAEGVAAEAIAARQQAEADLAAARRQVRELEVAVRRRAASVGDVAARADDAVSALQADLAAARSEVAAVRSELAAAVAARDEALAGRADGTGAAVDVERLRVLLHEALTVTGAPEGPSRRRRRTPLAIPGGLYGDSEAAAEHLLRTEGVTVLVDGYNVAKLGWPALELAEQRDATITVAESLARRWGTMVHLVFDGAAVVGAHTTARRLVRVSYSPEGVLADDVLRAEVASIDPDRPVVVVTNDQAVLADVRSEGANTVSSDVFLALARR